LRLAARAGESPLPLAAVTMSFMGGPEADCSVEEGADTIVWLADDPTPFARVWVSVRSSDVERLAKINSCAGDPQTEVHR
jgi:hypothetical protein